MARTSPIDLGAISLQFVPVFFAVANTEVPVPHELGPNVMGTVVVRRSKACRIFDGQMPQASNAVQLVSDTDSVTATILVVAVNIAER